MNGARAFFDSNVLIYAFDSEAGQRGERARTLLGMAARTGAGVLSYQVFQELISVMQKKYRVKPSTAEMKQILAKTRKDFLVVESSGELLASALDFRERFNFSWYDSLIVAAARQTECEVLVSEDMHDGLDIDGMRIINPFKTPEAGLN
ncbi:MAG: PIN domain-containing protein [Acidobacteria bacterium]|nr:PIN domain-containing protein [Acidobacteriota bacterium]